MKNIILSVLIFIVPLVNAGWSGPHTGGNFPKTFPAGYEVDGKLLYISQCYFIEKRVASFFEYPPRYTTTNRGWQIGKAGSHLQGGISFGWGGQFYETRYRGREYNGNSCRNKEHYIYIADKGASYKWVKSKIPTLPQIEITLPPGTIKKSIKGYNGYRICRASHAGGIHPGKLSADKLLCSIAFNGKQHNFKKFEVLIKNN